MSERLIFSSFDKLLQNLRIFWLFHEPLSDNLLSLELFDFSYVLLTSIFF